MNQEIRELEKIAYAPYEVIENPTAEDWKKAYDALIRLCKLAPESGMYQNTLGYLCYYGRHTGGERQYEEARKWFEEGTKHDVIESQYKLADMLAEGLGGDKDPDRALHLYLNMYWYCREQFEAGIKESKFADTALRMGRVYHEGKIVEKDDLEALGYLLEAKYAIEWRKKFDQYGNDTVERNIRRVIDECEKPEKGNSTEFPFVELGLGRVPYYLLTFTDNLMTMDIETNDRGDLRLEFRRKRKDGTKPNRILWSAAPFMRCFMTDFVVLYAAEVRLVWNIKPGEQVVCDRYDYDAEKNLHLFYLGDELQCKLMGGVYALSMNEFVFTEMRDHPEAGSDIEQ